MGDRSTRVRAKADDLLSDSDTPALATNQVDGTQKTQVVSATGRAAGIDNSTNALEIIDYELHEVFEGDHYTLTGFTDLANDAVFDIQFTTPDNTKWIHLVFDLDTESEYQWFIYEAATIGLAGAAITPINNNRNSDRTSGIVAKSIENASIALANDDTAVAGATLIRSGITGSGRSTAGRAGRSNEIILKQNTIYCMRAHCIAAGWANFSMQWYEHTDQVA